MKKLLTLILFSGLAVAASAQLVNQGGTITIQPGATLVVESDITNTTGSIVNNGIIEVKGNLTSAAAALFTSDGNSKLKFSGTTPSTVNFMIPTTLGDVEMAKTDENVTLDSDLDIDGDLTFTEDNNQIILGANSLVLSATSAADNSAVTNSFVVTDDLGVVTKEGLSTAFEFPVGAAMDSQNDITLTETGTPDNISVRVLANAYDTPSTLTGVVTDDVVNATWVITEATSGGSNLTVAPSWIAGDETGTFDADDSAVYQFNGTDYSALAATGMATNNGGIYSISNGGLVLTGTDYVVVGDGGLSAALLAIKMFLQGPYVAANDLMSDALRTGIYLPTAEPYGAMTNFTHVGDGGSESVSAQADFDFAADGDDIVDWVFVEIRDNANNTVSTRSALLQRDGDVVDLDGGNVKFSVVPNGDYDIVVRHRNHLGIKSATNVTLAKGAVATYDFTTAAAQAQGADVPEVETGVFGAWGGNAKSDDDYIRATPRVFPPPALSSDITYILDDILGGNPNGTVTGYNVGDLNMDGKVRMTPIVFPPPATPSDATFIIDNALGGNSNATKTSSIDN